MSDEAEAMSTCEHGRVKQYCSYCADKRRSDLNESQDATIATLRAELEAARALLRQALGNLDAHRNLMLIRAITAALASEGAARE